MARRKKVDDDLIDGDKKAGLKITNDLVETGGGRPASKETIELRKKILRFAKKGVANTDLAVKLGVTTAKSQSVAKTLVSKGLLEVDYEGKRVLYRTVA